MEKINCQICGQPVDSKDVWELIISENHQVGHEACLRKAVKDNGLNESTDLKMKKTSLLFE